MRRLGRVLLTLLWGLLLFLGGQFLLTDPRSPLPDHWNPLAPLVISAPVTPVTRMQMRRALATADACFAALEGHADLTRLPPLVDSDACGIDPRLRLRALGPTALSPVETTCAVALRLALWEAHSLRPAARAEGFNVTEIRHQSS